ncbi:hypothetical protein [Drosophila suzukii associated hytrosavirus 1]|nr:hypothetical protein [Drosophila suzukii associated hytrosavirus 1]
MDGIKKYARGLMVDLLFIHHRHADFIRHSLISLVYLVNFVDINLYVNIFIILCAIIHKFYMDNYVINRFISLTILFSSTAFKLFGTHTIISILIFQAIREKAFYDSICKKKEMKIEHESFLQEYLRYCENQHLIDEETDDPGDILRDDDDF